MFELWKKAKKGDRSAKKQILELNLRLVVPTAKRYYRHGMDLMDLIEEGNLGLLHAIEKFEPKKGYRFSTYATYWIEQYIRKASEEQSGTIKIPSHAWDSLRKWLKQWDKMQDKLGRDPTLSEMAKKMNWSARQIKSVIEASETMKGVGSLGAPIGEQYSDITVGDTLIDSQINPPDTSLIEISMKNGFKRALERIGEREKNILCLRYGLYGKKIHTLHEVGKKLKLSRERVRQIENRAVIRLKRVAHKLGIIDMNGFMLNNKDIGEKPRRKETNILGEPIKKRRKRRR
jgi:RNA polymerase primary sigma factor